MNRPSDDPSPHRSSFHSSIYSHLKLLSLFSSSTSSYVRLFITFSICLSSSLCFTRAQRGGLLIKKWGRSSAASTAVSIADAIKSLVYPTAEGDWFSSGVYTNGNPYGIADDLFFSMPCRSKGDGDYEVVSHCLIDDFLYEKIKKSEDELLAEKKCVAHLIGESDGFCDLPEGDTTLPGTE